MSRIYKDGRVEESYAAPDVSADPRHAQCPFCQAPITFGLGVPYGHGWKATTCTSCGQGVEGQIGTDEKVITQPVGTARHERDHYFGPHFPG